MTWKDKHFAQQQSKMGGGRGRAHAAECSNVNEGAAKIIRNHITVGVIDSRKSFISKLWKFEKLLTR